MPAPPEPVGDRLPEPDALAGAALLGALQGARHKALPATELAAGARRRGVERERFEAALEALERAGRVVVLSHPAPDVHLRGTDLRTVAAVEDAAGGGRELARQAAEACWEELLRAFLATHRCGC